MTKIDLIAADLVAKLKTVPELEGRVGLAVGGTDIDPINRDLKRPACWAVFTGLQVLDDSQISTQSVSTVYSFVVKILIDYGTESDLVGVHFPLLETIVESVKGTEITDLPFHSWSFNGLVMESLDADRQVWTMSLTVASGL